MHDDILILTYHSIAKAVVDPILQVSPDEFRRQIDFMLKRDVNVVSLEDASRQLLSQKSVTRKRSVAITFDDGFEDFSNTALPILREFGIKDVTVFVCPGHVGQSNEWNVRSKFLCRHMDLTALREMRNIGVELGAHGFVHRNFFQYSKKELAEVLDRCLLWFSDNIGIRPPMLAYPYGDIRQDQLEVVGERFHYSFTIGVEQRRRDRRAIPRICVTPETFGPNSCWDSNQVFQA